MANKKLLLYPVIGAIVSLVVMAVLFVLLLFGGSITALASSGVGLSGAYSEAFGIMALFMLFLDPSSEFSSASFEKLSPLFILSSISFALDSFSTNICAQRIFSAIISPEYNL